MRLELTHRFIVGHATVAVVALVLPAAMERLDMPYWASIFFAMGTCAVVGGLLSHKITRGYRRLHAYTERISRGDLSTEEDPTLGQRFTDETTDLVCSVRGMQDALRDLVTHIQSAAVQVATSTRELSENARDLDTSNKNLSSTMELVAEGVIRQREGVANTQASIRDIVQGIRGNSESAREAFSFVAQADQRATSGVEVSRLSVEKMQALFEKADQAGQLFFRFDQKIRSVHRITEMINSVSEKTHLLSVNASIEAARAGDAGRGFSVVAEEIRRLAESAANSSGQIEDLLRQLEDESSMISEAMRELGQGVGAGREDLDSIQGWLTQIKAAVETASQRAEEIFHKAERSAGSAGSVVAEFDGIAKVANENVDATDKMRALLSSQTDEFERVVGHTHHLFETADRLAEVSRRFRTKRDE